MYCIYKRVSLISENRERKRKRVDLERESLESKLGCVLWVGELRGSHQWCTENKVVEWLK